MYKEYIVNSIPKLDKMLFKMSESESVALDTETTGLSPLSDEIVGVCVCFSEDSSYYIPVKHTSSPAIDITEVINKLRVHTNGKLLVFHNAKFDYKFFHQSGWKIENDLFDTMIADHLLYPSEKHTLDSCAERVLELETIKYDTMIGVQASILSVPIRELAEYGAEDAWVTYKLYKLYQKFLADQRMLHPFKLIEMKLIKVLAKMEIDGVYIDSRQLTNSALMTQKQLKKITTKIKRLITSKELKTTFNLNSNDYLSNVLYNHFSLPIQELTDSGKPSTKRSTLETLVNFHPIVSLILEYKKLEKLHKFMIALPSSVNTNTGRVHGSFNQAIVRTGRLSSSKPNLQNIPAAINDGSDSFLSQVSTVIRSSFKPQKPGFCYLGLDYSQVELRLIAAFSGEEKMLQVFRDGGDIHTQTASLIFNKPFDKVSDAERKIAKQVNFGISYGMGALTLSNRVGSTFDEAETFISNFYKKYHKIGDYQTNKICFAKRNNYTETLFGRKRPLSFINSNNNKLKKYNERIAKNTPVQGSASELMKIAMIKVFDLIKNHPDEITMVLQVHDELSFEVRDDLSLFYKKAITEIMESVLPKPYSDYVTLKVEANIGNSWSEVH